jgi:Uncharacterized conserved protein (COG2071)
MITDKIDCTIERRLLVNYRIDPEFAATQLPAGFRPQLVSGWAVGGVCFIRLRGTRPHHAPGQFGLSSENVAHRFAVEHDDDQGTHVGVYVPRRDTNSLIASISGGKAFPGRYHLARFEVHEERSLVHIRVSSRDKVVELEVDAHPADQLGGSLFSSIDAAMEFFRNGCLGWSPSHRGELLDAVRLDSQKWQARPIAVDHMSSSLFDNREVFPSGTCTLDSALLMENLPATWITEGSITTPQSAPAA